MILGQPPLYHLDSIHLHVSPVSPAFTERCLLSDTVLDMEATRMTQAPELTERQ